MKKYLLFFISLFLCIPLFSQISEGGLPPSFKYDIKTKSLAESLKPCIYELKGDVERLKWEDEIVEQNGGPLRVAVTIPASIDLIQSGEWSLLPDGQKICRMVVKSPGAKGIILSYNEFYIPDGGKLYIYDHNKEQVLGAYTHNTNLKGAKFATETIDSDEVIFEYVDSSNDDLPRIEISDIGYVYNETQNGTRATTGFGASAECEVNVNCSEGTNWQRQKRGVAKTMTKLGTSWYLCSGSLINNTNQDFTPYYLTAYHCFFTSGVGAPDFDTMIFYFHYELDGCDNPSNEDKAEVESQVNAKTKTMVGAQLLVANPLYGGTDGALLKLKSDIPSHYDATFNGWELNTSPANRGVGIHHPSGDVKKISTYTTALRTGTYFDNIGGRALENAFWKVRFSATENGHGITEKGSSGSPLFNQNGLIVGTLTGGTTSCTNPNVDDDYSKFYYQWDKGNDSSGKQMKEYLDPQNINVTYLNFIEQIPDITVNTDTVYIKENTSINVKILSGNGGYTNKSSQEEVATCTNPDDNNNFIIRGVSSGQTIITIKDEKSKEKDVLVYVYPSDTDPVTFKMSNNVLTIGLMSNSDDYISAISIVDLWGRVLLSQDKHNGNLFYQINTSLIGKGVYIVKVKTKKGYVKAQKLKW